MFIVSLQNDSSLLIFVTARLVRTKCKNGERHIGVRSYSNSIPTVLGLYTKDTKKIRRRRSKV